MSLPDATSPSGEPTAAETAAHTAAHIAALAAGDDVLRVQDLKVHFPVGQRLPFTKPLASVKAVDGVSFTVKRGETLGLVGESGCGKSTTGLAAIRMLQPTAGSIHFEGRDITNLSRDEMRPLRRRMQMVFQDPYGSLLNPRMRVLDLIGEPLAVHGITQNYGEYRDRVQALLATVGLLPDMAERYPHEFSGGQRQRIGIARALALEPSLIVCDEPVSALDVSIQAQVINCFVELQQRLGLSYLFVAHDLAVVRHISDRIAVMYLGRIVEIASREELYKAPLHPYTQALLGAVPVADARVEASRKRVVVSGEVPSALRPPSGCRFHTRCPQVMDVCKTVDPALMSLGGVRVVACHLHNSPSTARSADVVQAA